MNTQEQKELVFDTTRSLLSEKTKVTVSDLLESPTLSSLTHHEIRELVISLDHDGRIDFDEFKALGGKFDGTINSIYL